MHFMFVFGSWKINKNIHKISIFDLDINTINVKAISKQRIKTHMGLSPVMPTIDKLKIGHSTNGL